MECSRFHNFENHLRTLFSGVSKYQLNKNSFIIFSDLWETYKIRQELFQNQYLMQHIPKFLTFNCGHFSSKLFGKDTWNVYCNYKLAVSESHALGKTYSNSTKKTLKPCLRTLSNVFIFELEKVSRNRGGD